MSTDLETRRARERAKYETLVANPRYGGSHHGRDAHALLKEWGVETVVDFGCGRNQFVLECQRNGIRALGVDFAFPEADIKAPMHRVPVADGAVDCVTAFDSLEHLLPEEVPLVLREMRRIAKPGGRLIVSVCTRPSNWKVDGEGLHPTVRSMDWWTARLAAVACARGSGRFLVGEFRAP